MARRRPRPLVWIALGAITWWLVQRLQRSRTEPATVAAGGWTAVDPPSATPDVRAAVVPVVEPEVVGIGDLDQPGEPAVEEPLAAWVEPEAGGVCPPTHPVKAKLKSKLYHLPGMFAYDRTKPDRCYVDAEAAEADGLSKAKR